MRGLHLCGTTLDTPFFHLYPLYHTPLSDPERNIPSLCYIVQIYLCMPSIINHSEYRNIIRYNTTQYLILEIESVRICQLGFCLRSKCCVDRRSVWPKFNTVVLHFKSTLIMLKCQNPFALEPGKND